MWLEHIREIITKYQTKTPENYINFLDLNLDLPFAVVPNISNFSECLPI